MTSVNTYIDIDRLIKKMGKTDWYKALGGQAHHHIKTLLKFTSGTSLVVQRLRIHAPNTGGPGSILGQGTRSHTLQLRVCMLQQQQKNPLVERQTQSKIPAVTSKQPKQRK